MNGSGRDISVQTVGSLSSEEVRAWSTTQSEHPLLASPFFRPEYTRIVAEEVPDVRVIVVREHGSPVAFLPIQGVRPRVAGPVGGTLSDYQGIIAAPGFRFDPRTLIRAAGLLVWDFDHLLAEQEPFAPFHFVQTSSPYLDVRGGFDAYLERRPSPTAKRIDRVQRRFNQAERECGPVRFCADDAGPGILDSLIEWKRAQIRQTGATDIFAIPSTRPIFERMLASTDEALRGILATLSIADELAAVWFGIRSRGLLHTWVTSYSAAFHKYSPATLTLIKMIESAPDHGIDRIDLGKGPEPYKQWLLTGATPLAEGAVECRAVARSLKRAALRLKNQVAGSRLRQPARWTARQAARLAPPLRRYLRMRPQLPEDHDGTPGGG